MSSILDIDEETSFQSCQSSSRIKKPRKPRAGNLWSHCLPTTEIKGPIRLPNAGGEMKRVFYCSHCSYKSPVTTNARRHLEKAHGISSAEPLSALQKGLAQRLLEMTISTDKEEMIKEAKPILESVLDQDAIDRAMVNMTADLRLSLRSVDYASFHAFCLTLNPACGSFIKKSHTSIAKQIEKTFEMKQNQLRLKLHQSVSKIHFSLDIWTSPSQELLLGIVAHFVPSYTEGLKHVRYQFG